MVTAGPGVVTAGPGCRGCRSGVWWLPVRGVVAARVELEALDDGDPNLARVAGGTCVDILGLALLQRMPPRLKELDVMELMRPFIRQPGQALAVESVHDLNDGMA